MQAHTDRVRLVSRGWRGDVCVRQQEIESPSQFPIHNEDSSIQSRGWWQQPCLLRRHVGALVPRLTSSVLYPRIAPRSSLNDDAGEQYHTWSFLRSRLNQSAHPGGEQQTWQCYHKWYTPTSFFLVERRSTQPRKLTAGLEDSCCNVALVHIPPSTLYMLLHIHWRASSSRDAVFTFDTVAPLARILVSVCCVELLLASEQPILSAAPH